MKGKEAKEKRERHHFSPLCCELTGMLWDGDSRVRYGRSQQTGKDLSKKCLRRIRKISSLCFMAHIKQQSSTEQEYLIKRMTCTNVFMEQRKTYLLLESSGKWWNSCYFRGKLKKQTKLNISLSSFSFLMSFS